ncbi:MAG TPA: glycosyltransferase family 1 protein [Candidatus Baltobacteraceae bacterium]|nr:glycosyltransferase family 1 protein [Candidatus Baltobacteraceae bacterium]
MMRVAVDAWNLVDDRRGMGRYVRRVLDDWHDEADLEVTLIVRKSEHVPLLERELSYAVRTDARGRYDAAWYPWNALRFAVRGARSVALFHDAFAFTQPHSQWIARLREQRPIRRAMRRADVRTANSYWSARELARVFRVDSASFKVIHPVPDPYWKPVEPPRRAPYILVVGGPEERKNLATLVRAFERAFAAGECELVIAGNTPLATVQPNDEELRCLYSGALAVAVPSSAEGYGLMAVEAMACGAPVIASNASALPEACDGAAMLVAPFDVEAWASELQRLARDGGLRHTLRARSLARAARIDRHAPARLTLGVLTGALTAR